MTLALAGEARSIFDPSSLPAGQLAPHQTQGLDWLRTHPRALLADETGTGKTPIALAWLGRLAPAGHATALWVTEAGLIRQAVTEARRFLPALAVADQTDSGARSRIDTTTVPADLLVVSYEWLRHNEARLTPYRFSTVVFDEAAALKSGGREAQAALRVAVHAEHRLALSATPVECDLMGLYHVLHTLDVPDLPSERKWGADFVTWAPGYRLPSSGAWVDAKPTGVRRGALSELRAFLETCLLRRTAEEVGLTMPELVERRVACPLTAPQQAAYDAAKGFNGLSGHHALEQATSFAHGRSAKAEAALALLRDRPDIDKAVIWAENLGHLEIMEALLDRAGIGWVRVNGALPKSKRRNVLDVFRDDPAVRVLLGTRVLERGLDGLQHCRVLISLGSTFNPAREAQRIGRLRRIGSPHATVEHHTFLAHAPHETNKWRTVMGRHADAEAVLAA